MPVDNSPNLPPKQFKPNPGQAGQAAALHRPPGRPPSGKPSSEKPSKSDGKSDNGAKLGVPAPPPEPPPDLRHLELGLHHHNAVGLGRDQPIGIWLLRNGLLANIGKPGMQAYDMFYD
jgi:hypothetical protein